MNKLFVYGSLGLGRVNDHVLKNIGGTFKRAYVFGKLYEEGWGSAIGFPGIRLTSKEEKIEGYLFISDTIEEHWQKLDDFEGDAYRRVKTQVVLLEDDVAVEAYIYELR